ncbi:MAG: carbohydrate-binding domain-containing protein [Burkholderiales bacterium]|jgi:hypothetical protein|nr:carbohydrate-binding domain-containing protein [Burkholderiales bacterium]
MKRFLFHSLSSAVLALGLLMSPTVLAEDITYPGTSLRNAVGVGNALAPSSSSLTGNKVTFNGCVGASLVNPCPPNPNAVFGAAGSVLEANGSANNNQVFINGGTINSNGLLVGSARGTVFGGYLASNRGATANGNAVTIGRYASFFNSTITNGVMGGAARSSSTPPYASSVTASNNTVTITSGTFSATTGGAGIRGGLAHGNGIATASNNTVTISDGSVSVLIYGGDALTSGTGAASGNSVTISGGTVSGVDIAGGNTNSTTASGNTVTISGGNIQGGRIFGGYANNVSNGTASNNTVTIRGTPVFTGGVRLEGGLAATRTGNTLNLRTAGLTFGVMGSFQKLNFYLPAGLAANDTMLTVSGTAYLDGAAISVNREGAGPSLQEGRKFNLIKAGTLSGTFQAPSSCVIGAYTCTVAKEGNNLVLTVGASWATPTPPTPPTPPTTYGPTRNYSGQWASAGGEDAWGLTVLTSFSDSRYIFVPWYTYDNSGNASWYIFQGPAEGYGEWTANDTFEGKVYRYTGSPWGTVPYNNAACYGTVVGDATLKFTSATKATLTYTNVEGQSRTVTLDRLAGAPSAGWDYAYTGQWIREGENNWGLTVLMTFPTNPDYIFVPWYIYDDSGKAIWYLFQGANEATGGWTSENTFEGEVRRYAGPAWYTHGSYDNSKIDFDVVGTAKMTFTSPTKAQFEYNVDGVNRSIGLVKLE